MPKARLGGMARRGADASNSWVIGRQGGRQQQPDGRQRQRAIGRLCMGGKEKAKTRL